MKIIVLYGDSNSGKTTTLTTLFNKISPQNTKTTSINKYGDFESDPFSYKNKQIVVYTCGDELQYVGNGIISNIAKADVLIIACSKKFKKYLPVQLFLAREIVVITKTQNNQNDINQIIASI